METKTATAQEKALARRGSAATGTMTLIDTLKKNKAALASFFAGDQHEAERLIKVAYDAWARNPQLLKCSAESVVVAVKRAAALRLDLAPEMGQAALVPRWNSKTNSLEACFEPEYGGLIDLAMRGGKVKSVRARVVYDCDAFSYQEGLAPRIEHVPNLGREESSELIATYAVAELEGGGQAFVVLGRRDVEKRRASSSSWQAKAKGKIRETTWDTHPEAMWAKSAVRALAKFLPKSVAPLLIEAVGREEQDERGIDVSATIIDEQPPAEQVNPETGEVSGITVVGTDGREFGAPAREPGQEG